MPGEPAQQDEPPVPLDTDIEDLSDEKVAEHFEQLAQVIYDGYRPHIVDWHEDAHVHVSKLWRAVRRRADTQEPACPKCGAREWSQAIGDPVICGDCGYQGLAEDEEKVHEAWSQMREEMRGDDDE